MSSSRKASEDNCQLKRVCEGAAAADDDDDAAAGGAIGGGERCWHINWNMTSM
jgi:hypothetical protein